MDDACISSPTEAGSDDEEAPDAGSSEDESDRHENDSGVPDDAATSDGIDPSDAAAVDEGGVRDGSVVATAAIAVAVGDSHSCAVLDDNRVKCWGSNQYGALGLGGKDNDNHVIASVVPGVAAKAISSAGGFTCVVEVSGSVKCWGSKLIEEPHFEFFSPTTVPGIADAKQVAVGGSHMCALLNSGTVQCWGSNDFGQLGSGDRNPQPGQVVVPGLAEVTQLTASAGVTCATTRSGDGMCWGLLMPQPTMALVPTALFRNVTSVSAGQRHKCAIGIDKGVRCLGENRYGTVGTSLYSETYLDPVSIPGFSDATELAVEYARVCAVTSIGGLYCWGNNDDGLLLGAPSDTKNVYEELCSVRPLRVQSGTKFSGVAAGFSHACAVSSGGGAWCWGNNSFGQLGDGTFANSVTPVQVDGLVD